MSRRSARGSKTIATSLGLPERHLSVALLTFNVGVEIEQLMMVGLAFGVVRLPLSQRLPGRAGVPALYAIGAVAAYWSGARISAIVL